MNEQHKVFAFVAGNDVFSLFRISDDGQPYNDMLIAGFSSNPIVVEASDAVQQGYKYIDGQFYAPVGFQGHTEASGPGYEVDDD